MWWCTRSYRHVCVCIPSEQGRRVEVGATRCYENGPVSDLEVLVSCHLFVRHRQLIAKKPNHLPLIVAFKTAGNRIHLSWASKGNDSRMH